ncbi:DNA-processing protein DprA [Cryobacterium sp. GrIS_2_6]|uniref:DNA-processing protein DprA n=1 Tax=Cryobacterium sp. GrIS_2_6 TaxID=3162785 RepID=UPI002E04CB22|nr:DNA-processing protein DprA [Cryobacterium psychrotolerans]MEC5149080.1 DNA processing protein [Cryobacterium psychrotolerans]
MPFEPDETTMIDLASGVRAPGATTLTRELAAELHARAAWSCISEPGDGTAGLVVAALGAVRALRMIIEAWTQDHIAGELLTAGVAEGVIAAAGLDRALERWRPRLDPIVVTIALRQAARSGARLAIPGDPDWPAGLEDLGVHAPLALWWRGPADALGAFAQSIALVGARAATRYGEHVAMEASAGLVDRGFAIVSGAAYGIDGMAHKAALASRGRTVAFLAGGVDRPYPSGHVDLLERIAGEGAVISELPCGAAPTKWRFLQRNRLIAATSLATIVLEAGWRSGSLNTAGHAATLGRPLGAVPGPVTSPASAGCHRLIREYDAVCVTTAAEMAELVAEHLVQVTLDFPESELGLEGAGRTSEQVRVFDALSGRSPREVGDIARRAGLSTVSVRAALGALGVEGAARERQTGWVRNA